MLTPCAGCRRHVSTDAPTCPFCGAAVTAGPVPGSPAGRLGRAAFFAFGAAVAVLNKQILTEKRHASLFVVVLLLMPVSRTPRNLPA